jgi:hypothetical protein
MKHLKIIAAVTLAAFALALTPKPQALADGAASTRNIIIGTAAAAATVLIINHNKKVHERYAQDAQAQAALALQRDDAKTAAAQYKTAYEHETVVAANLKRQVALQQSQINTLNAQVASLNPSGNFVGGQTASTSSASKSVAMNPGTQVAVVSYGWGTF